MTDYHYTNLGVSAFYQFDYADLGQMRQLYEKSQEDESMYYLINVYQQSLGVSSMPEEVEEALKKVLYSENEEVFKSNLEQLNEVIRQTDEEYEGAFCLNFFKFCAGFETFNSYEERIIEYSMDLDDLILKLQEARQTFIDLGVPIDKIGTAYEAN